MMSFSLKANYVFCFLWKESVEVFFFIIFLSRLLYPCQWKLLFTPFIFLKNQSSFSLKGNNQSSVRKYTSEWKKNVLLFKSIFWTIFFVYFKRYYNSKVTLGMGKEAYVDLLIHFLLLLFPPCSFLVCPIFFFQKCSWDFRILESNLSLSNSDFIIQKP